MEYTREQHKRFLDLELQAIAEEYINKLKQDAIALLSENEIYVTQFAKIDIQEQTDDNDKPFLTGTGEIILKFKSEKGVPRKNDYFTAVVLEKGKELPPQWNGKSWGELRKHQLDFSEVHCVWHGKTDEKGYILCGFQGVSLEMAKYLQDKTGCIIVLGPQEPPMEYYQNLIQNVAHAHSFSAFDSILDFEKGANYWNPQAINSNDDRLSKLKEALIDSEDLIIQGPPGTGKTYLMSQLINDLLNDNQSVLVTALTNRALVELAEKDSLKEHLQQEKICKTSVSAEEAAKLPKLVPIDCKKISCSKGFLTLATFYNTSGWAKSIEDGLIPFDYVIMDEASQALFSMIACCKKLGKKVIWIGDQKQLPPIVTMSDEILIRNNFSALANGFETLCSYFNKPSFILTDTYRLPQRAADFTSVFYPVPLKSESSNIISNYGLDFLNSDGGPTILYKDMPKGEKADPPTADYVVSIIEQILNVEPRLEIAVLSKFRKTVKILQDRFISKLGNKNNVLIDTVERIQGMTRDIIIYLIPNSMMTMSLDNALFNVASSRATHHTIIVADPSIHAENMSDEVRKYLLKIEDNKVASLDAEITVKPEVQKISAGDLSVTVLGKIQLPEKKLKEIRDDKENVFIIDTNVFVNCPNIIKRIGKYKVVIPTTVLEELDHLKLKQGIDKKALNDAARNINQAFQDHFSHMDSGDTSLLPDGFDVKKADCLILSVALKYMSSGVHPILLTSDNLLQSKALGLGITTISLSEFLSERRH